MGEREFRVLEIKASIFEDNNREADLLREQLRQEGTFLLNLMSSPGAGKTSALLRTIDALEDEIDIAVIEADIDSDVDAERIAATGTRVIQLHTGGMCHLDASMAGQGIANLGADGADLIVLENVGNLVCPAEFDIGATKNAVILSVPEGDDKPLKYPLIFEISHALIISKIDTLPVFDFSIEACVRRARKLNPDIEVFPVSAKTGEGMDAWCDWLRRQVAAAKA
ncbi:MAG: hydrogenase nickel incorporation protein HypB [Clostridiales Family XIII bacterium]|jgi:hydrogenase nickel incorporation protein HypB|nr:hydrogenase nickel incorporation protein HypB [Clostridiales Family XIII bacterium]